MLAKEDRSLATLFSDLTQETTALLRKEVELAKVEISEKVSQAQSGAVSLATGARFCTPGCCSCSWHWYMAFPPPRIGICGCQR